MSGDREDFEREERAFAEALHASAPVESFRPLDVDAIRAAAGPARSGRTRWLRGMAAAAVLVVAVGIGAALLPRMAGSASTAVPAASGGYAAAGAVPEAASDRGSEATYPDKASNSTPGFRWESYRDVQVEVPESWGYASAPQSDYCISKRFPTEPYVDLTRGPGAASAILCTGDLADDQQATHLTFTPITGSPPFAAPSKVWKQYSRELGQARVTVTARAEESELANRILASASLVSDGTDPNGCPVTLPTVPAVELAGLDAGELSVCLYEAEDDRGAFRSSVRLTGAAAERAWQSVLAAPEGGGPDGLASSCGSSPGWPMLLLVGADQVPVAASVAGCAGNGVADAAATGGARKLTGELCRALIVDPVRISSGSGPAAEACVR
jgi:hypothetical protein